MGVRVGTIRKRMASVLTVLAITMSGIVLSAPAASALYVVEPKPKCSTFWVKFVPPLDRGNRASCKAKALWEEIDTMAKRMKREPRAAVRSATNSKYFWALVAPLLSDKSRFNDDAWEGANTVAVNAGGSRQASYNFLIDMRDYVAASSKDFAQMESSILALKAISHLGVGKTLGYEAPLIAKGIVAAGFVFTETETPTEFLKKAGIPLLKKKTAAETREHLFQVIAQQY
jgi:hypothetical protein